MTIPHFRPLPAPRRASSRERIWASACAAAVLALVGYFYWHTCRRIAAGNLDDFPHFYYAAEAVLHGRDPYLAGTRGYIYPPLLAHLYVPLALLSPRGAAYAILPVLVLCTLGSVLLASREALRRIGAATGPSALMTVSLLSLLLIEDKVKGDLQMLQTNSLVLLLFTLGLTCLDRSPFWAGAALGAAFNIKYLSLVMLPYLLLRRRSAAAGWFAAWAVGLALLPAAWSGWGANLAHLRVAFAGIARLFGAGGAAGVPGAAAEAAQTHDLKAGFSLSIPSALARAGGSDAAALALGALIALAWGVAAALIYRRRGVPLLAWPAAHLQRQQPWRTMVGVEWACLTAAALAFGPQTNSRHLILVLLPDAMAAALLVHGLPPPRGPWKRSVSSHPAGDGGFDWLVLAAGTLALLAGLTLPPGHRHGKTFSAATTWLAAGGPCWCLLAMTLTLVWAGCGYASAGEPGAVTPSSEG